MGIPGGSTAFCFLPTIPRLTITNRRPETSKVSDTSTLKSKRRWQPDSQFVSHWPASPSPPLPWGKPARPKSQRINLVRHRPRALQNPLPISPAPSRLIQNHPPPQSSFPFQENLPNPPPHPAMLQTLQLHPHQESQQPTSTPFPMTHLPPFLDQMLPVPAVARAAPVVPIPIIRQQLQPIIHLTRSPPPAGSYPKSRRSRLPKTVLLKTLLSLNSTKTGAISTPPTFEPKMP